MATIIERSRAALDAVIRTAGIPLAGLKSFPPTLAYDFLPDATAQQIADAQTMAAAWDWSDAAQLAREVLVYKNEAKVLYDKLDEMGRILRGVVIAAKVSDNVIRGWIMQFKAAVATGWTTPTQFKTLVAALPDLPDLSNTNVKQFVINTIDSD